MSPSFDGRNLRESWALIHDHILIENWRIPGTIWNRPMPAPWEYGMIGNTAITHKRYEKRSKTFPMQDLNYLFTNCHIWMSQCWKDQLLSCTLSLHECKETWLSHNLGMFVHPLAELVLQIVTTRHLLYSKCCLDLTAPVHDSLIDFSDGHKTHCTWCHRKIFRTKW